MYTDPSWIELLVSGTFINLIYILISFILVYIVIRLLYKHYSSKDSFSFKELLDLDDGNLIKIIIISCIVFLIAGSGLGLLAGVTWNTLYEQPSIRSDVVTINSIQPRPGAVQINESGYVVDNSNQLLFVTKDGREFMNCENMYFNKFETRTIFNQLRINGTYNITYYGWRNGHSNEFPNILSVKVIDENNTQPTDWNKYFGHHYGNRYYDVESEKDLNQI